MPRRKYPSSSSSPSSDDTLYDVEKIIADRINVRGKKEYLVHWLGYDNSHDTWEPEENLRGCIEVLREYQAQTKKKKRKTSKRKTKRRSVKVISDSSSNEESILTSVPTTTVAASTVTPPSVANAPKKSNFVDILPKNTIEMNELSNTTETLLPRNGLLTETTATLTTPVPSPPPIPTPIISPIPVLETPPILPAKITADECAPSNFSVVIRLKRKSQTVLGCDEPEISSDDHVDEAQEIWELKSISNGSNIKEKCAPNPSLLYSENQSAPSSSSSIPHDAFGHFEPVKETDSATNKKNGPKHPQISVKPPSKDKTSASNKKDKKSSKRKSISTQQIATHNMPTCSTSFVSLRENNLDTPQPERHIPQNETISANMNEPALPSDNHISQICKDTQENDLVEIPLVMKAGGIPVKAPNLSPRKEISNLQELLAAMSRNNFSMCRSVILYRYKSNARENPPCSSDEILDLRTMGYPLLIFALHKKVNLNILRLFVTSGVDVNCLNEDGVSPLMVAASDGVVEAVNLFIENGAYLNVVSVHHETALTKAIKHSQPATVQALLLHGVNVNALSYMNGKAALEVAYNERERLKKAERNRVTLTPQHARYNNHIVSMLEVYNAMLDEYMRALLDDIFLTSKTNDLIFPIHVIDVHSAEDFDIRFKCLNNFEGKLKDHTYDPVLIMANAYFEFKSMTATVDDVCLVHSAELNDKPVRAIVTNRGDSHFLNSFDNIHPEEENVLSIHLDVAKRPKNDSKLRLVVAAYFMKDIP